MLVVMSIFFFSSRRRHTRCSRDWSSDVCSSDLEDEIILARVDGKAIYRLAHARSRSAESYWATPRAALSRDGRYVIFSSNMAHPNGCPAKMHVPEECTDVFLIKVR